MTKSQRVEFVKWLVSRGINRDEAEEKIALYMTPRRPSPQQPDTIAEQAKPIMQQYRSLYCDRYGEMPIVNGQEYINISKLLKQYGPAVVTRRLNAFFAWDDPFIEKIGRTLGVFYKQWNRLATDQAKRSPMLASVVGCVHTPRCLDGVSHSRKILQERASPPTTSTPNAASSGPVSSTTPTLTK